MPTSRDLAPANARPRIEALTGVRILAAMSVLLSHLGPPPSAGPTVRAFFAAGYSGVTIFFVLSGFVLAHNYFDRFQTELSLKLVWSYVVARLARIYPLYLLLLVWVSLPLLIAGQVRTGLWIRHALALQAWDPNLSNAYAFNGPGWSISVEFFLYACFPALVFLLRPLVRRRLGIVVALVVVVAAMVGLTTWFSARGHGLLSWDDPGSAHRWLYRSPLCRLGDFALGILIARLVASMPGDHRKVGSLAIAISLATIVVLMCSPRLTFSTPTFDVAYALPASLLIFGLASAPRAWVARALATRPVVLLGEASYALYLCHVYMLGHFAVPGFPPDRWLVVETLTVFMVIVVAIGLHFAVERPSRVLLRRTLDPLARDRHKRAAPTAG